MDYPFWLSLIVMLATVTGFLEIVIGARRIAYLEGVLPAYADPVPRVSIIISALDEETTIVPALQSLLKLDYPDVELIVVNDRSTDATPAILDRIAKQHPRLKVQHVAHLPQGWLGKNHALQQGASLASGDYLLFTDADVVFEKTAITRAVAHCRKQSLDHLTIIPAVPPGSALLNMLLLHFSAAFLLRFKPWKIGSSERYFLGQGAFNMVSRNAYFAVGGHAALRLAVIDDMMLGYVLKRNGYRQDVLIGKGFVTVAWYESAPAMFRGLRKNVFAGFDYSLGKLTLASVIFGVAGIWPWIGLFLTSGIAWWCNLIAVGAVVLFYLGLARTAGWSTGCLVFIPFVTPITLVMWWQACVLAVYRKGINWRGTFYPLAELRRSHRPF